jgi:hypothetical protein
MASFTRRSAPTRTQPPRGLKPCIMQRHADRRASIWGIVLAPKRVGRRPYCDTRASQDQTIGAFFLQERVFAIKSVRSGTMLHGLSTIAYVLSQACGCEGPAAFLQGHGGVQKQDEDNGKRVLSKLRTHHAPHLLARLR